VARPEQPSSAQPTSEQPAALAELVLDSGQRVVLVGPLLIGRAPRAHGSVPSATLLVVDDPTMSVSATHLLISPASDGAWLQDLSSTNGSAIIDQHGVSTALVAGVRAAATFGSTICFGDRTAVLRFDGQPGRD